MENKNIPKNVAIKVMICDDTVPKGVKLASELAEFGLYAYTRKREGETILRSILADKPDVVVSDLSLADTDAIAIINKSKSILAHVPAFIVCSELNNSFIRRQVLENGALAFLVKPFTAEELYKVIDSISFRNNLYSYYDAEILVTNLIQKVGIPANVRGYRYIRTAILECLDNSLCLESITKMLYPKVAAKHDTTSSRVERAIRHAIDIAWHKGNMENINSFFGYSVDAFSRPTNSEFILLAADKVRLMLRSKNISRISPIF